MSDQFKTHHGIRLAEGSQVYNLEIENLTHDPSPIRVSRIWYSIPDDKFKYSAFDPSSNGTKVKTFTFASLEDIPSQIIIENSNPNNIYFNMPLNTYYHEAIALLTDEINNLYAKLSKVMTSQYYYTTEITSFIKLDFSVFNKNNLTIIINGLEECESSYDIKNGTTLTFTSPIPSDSIVKIIAFNI